jgi:hypothetical protein
MHWILRYTNGHGTDALLLTMTPDTMRVILHRCNETIEYRRVSGRWRATTAAVSPSRTMLPAAVRRAGSRGLTLAGGG